MPKKSLKYTKNILSALENFFNTLLRYDYISKKPVFPVLTLDRKTPKWVGRAAQTEILESIEEEDRPLFVFLAFQGVRPGEARALKTKDLNFEEETVTISRTYSGSKNAIKERVKSKVVKPRAINPALVPLLKKLCKDKHPEAFVFVNPRMGTPYTESAYKKLWAKVKRKLNLDLTPYQALRHSCASNLAKEKVPVNIIKEILGHTDIRTTMIYTHSDLESQKVAFGKTEKIKGKVFELCPQSVPKEYKQK